MATLGGGYPGDHNGVLRAQHQALRKLAEHASPGPWFVCEQPNTDGTVDLETGRIAQSEWPPAKNCEYGNANYIAAVSPDVVVGLLDLVEHLQNSLVRLNDRQ